MITLVERYLDIFWYARPRSLLHCDLHKNVYHVLFRLIVLMFDLLRPFLHHRYGSRGREGFGRAFTSPSYYVVAKVIIT